MSQWLFYTAGLAAHITLNTIMVTARAHLENCVVEFQTRRRKCLTLYLYPGYAILATAALATVFTLNFWVLVGLTPGLLLVTIGNFQFKCPVCRKRPVDSDNTRYDPTQCESCGAKLK